MITQNKIFYTTFRLLLTFVLAQITHQKVGHIDLNRMPASTSIGKYQAKIDNDKTTFINLTGQPQQSANKVKNSSQSLKTKQQLSLQSQSSLLQQLKTFQQKQKAWQIQKLSLMHKQKQLQDQLTNQTQVQAETIQQLQSYKKQMQKMLILASQKWKEHKKQQQLTRANILEKLRNIQSHYQKEKSQLQSKIKIWENTNKKLENKTKKLQKQVQHQQKKFQGYYQIAESKLRKLQDEKQSLQQKFKGELAKQDSLKSKQFSKRQYLNERILTLQGKLTQEQDRLTQLQKLQNELSDCKKRAGVRVEKRIQCGWVLQMLIGFFCGSMITFLLWVYVAQRKQQTVTKEIVISRNISTEQIGKLQPI